jgi:hypothetical protein
MHSCRPPPEFIQRCLELPLLAEQAIEHRLGLADISEVQAGTASETAVTRDTVKDGAPTLAAGTQPPRAGAAVVASGVRAMLTA